MPRRIKKISTYNILSDMTVDSSTLDEKTYNKKADIYALFKFDNDISVQGDLIDHSGFSRDLVVTGSRPLFSLESPNSLPTVEGFAKRSYSLRPDALNGTFKSGDTGSFEFNKGANSPTSAFSISTWVKFNSFVGSNDQYIASKVNVGGALDEQQYAVYIDGGSKKPVFKIFSGLDGGSFGSFTLESHLQVISGKWYHIVATFNGTPSPASGNLQIYLNGIAATNTTAGSGANFTEIANGDALFAIGSDFNSNDSIDFKGNISELAIWRTALTQDDVTALYKFKDTINYRFSSGFVNLPPRVLLRQLDNATGSYPTVMRMGDKGRTGAYNRIFEDNYTINFGKKIKDVFELKNRVGGVLGFSRDIDSSKWTHSKGMEIRQELITGDGGSSIRKTALVFSGGGLAGKRRIQTKNKIKNPRIKIDLTIGPYQEDRTVLKFGLGLSDGTATDDLKIQASTDGNSWVDIKTIQNNISTLLQDALTRDFRSADLVKRRSVQVDLHPTDFPFGNNAFYLRIIQESVSSNNVVVWAMSSIEIDYHDEENISYPLMVDVDSFVGKKITASSVTAPHLKPTLKGPGRSISGISDVHLSFTPGEKLLPFIDNSHFFDDTSIFFNQGTSPDVIQGFSSPVSSKTIIEVDLSPSEQTTFGLDTRATHESTGNGSNRGPRLETDATKKQQLMVYWNKDLRRWEKIAQGVSGNVVAKQDEGFTPLRNMIHSGALGFSGIGMCSTGSDVTLANQSPVNQDALLSYARPTSTFGFPFEGKIRSYC